MSGVDRDSGTAVREQPEPSSAEARLSTSTVGDDALEDRRHLHGTDGAADQEQPVDRGEWVEQVLRREAPSLLAHLLRHCDHEADAADVLAEVMLVAWRRAAVVPTEAVAARMWLFGVARKVLSTSARARRRRAELSARLAGELIAAHGPAGGVVHQARQGGRGGGAGQAGAAQEALHEALELLDPVDRDLVVLVHWHGFSLVEAAQVLQLNAATARSRYHRLRQRLRRMLAVS